MTAHAVTCAVIFFSKPIGCLEQTRMAKEDSMAPNRRDLILGASALGALGMMGRSSRALAASSPAQPKVTGPIRGGTHGWPFGGYFGDLAKRGYVEEEYFIEGDATRFALEGALTPDGKWTVKPAGTAPYKTRILVRRPIDAKAFNGTVLVEWSNVSFGYDVSLCDWEGLYDGYAYVMVTAQRVGVHGNPDKPMGLVAWDADRYASLSIPGDSLSYDIFTQAGRAIAPRRKKHGVDPLRGLKVRRLIATGASQSGGRLMSYINGIQQREHVFDALMPLICAGSTSPFDDTAFNSSSAGVRPAFSRVRDDLKTPVWSMNTESEAVFYQMWRQPDSDRFRYWEVAGASHGPRALTQVLFEKARRDGVAAAWNPANDSSEVMWLPTFDAALRHVDRWVQGGPPPPSQAPLEIVGGRIARDAFGNAKGGVRLPDLEVPVATYAWQDDMRALLGGKTQPFTPERLRSLYPTHADYVAKVKAAAAAAEKDGVILPYRHREYIAQAEAAPIPA